MNILILSIIIFLELIFYIVVFDVILSWLSLAGIRFRPKFMVDVLRPIYSFVKTYIPTSFGAFDFTPIIIIMSITFFKALLLMNFPEVNILLNQLSLS